MLNILMTNKMKQSIEGQIHECEQFAKTHDMVIIKHYVDRAFKW